MTFEYQTFMKGEMYIVSVWLENCQTQGFIVLSMSFLRFKTDLMAQQYNNVAVFQWIVLTFGPDSGEISLISSKIVSFATS